jgi:tetratricopeptide (TPR) repeat protein
MLKSFLFALALVVAILYVYGQTAGFGFVDYDDPPYVSGNALIQQGVTLEGLRWVLTNAHGGNWHPVTGLSHMLDCELFGLDAGAHHAVNVGLHAVGTLLLFGLLLSTTGSRSAAAMVAALFALHPLHVESVAWVSERKDVLSTAFGMGALWAYAAWARRGGRLLYALTAMLLGLGLAAKPMLVTLPFVFLLFDRWPLGRTDTVPLARRVTEKLPFFALATGTAIVTFFFQRDVGAVSSAELVPFAPRITNAVVSYARYLGDTFQPTPMGLLYPHPAMPGGTPWEAWQIGLSAGVLVAISALVAASRRGYAITGWLWYLGTLVPVLGLVQVGLQAKADRYTYIPLIGIFIALVYGVREALAKLKPGVARAVGSTLAFVVLVPCAVLAHTQARKWRDTQTLFETALVLAPRSPLVLTTLGSLHQERFEIEEAAGYYRQALAVQPEHAEANYNLSYMLQSVGRTEEALGHLDTAIASQPGHIHARNLRGQIHLQAGDAERALGEFEEALRFEPEHAITEMNVGNALSQLGRMDEAAERYRRSVELDPATGGAQFNLGLLLLPEDAAGAVDHLRAAVEAEPGQPQFAYRLAEILARHPDPTLRDASFATLLGERVAAVAPGDPGVLDVLASAYASDGQFETAVHIAENALTGARAAAAQDPTLKEPMTELAAKIAERLELYRQGRPYLSPP